MQIARKRHLGRNRVPGIFVFEDPEASRVVDILLVPLFLSSNAKGEGLAFLRFAQPRLEPLQTN
jgi:hypothetical protein